MDRGLSLLFRLMSASWIFMGAAGCEKKEQKPTEKLDRMVVEERDQDEGDTFVLDGTFD